MEANTFARFRTILMSLVLFCPCTASLSAGQYGLFTYESVWIVPSTFVIEITNYPRTATGHVYIPAYIHGIPVTTIRRYAFSGCSGLTGVTIPYGVTTVEHSAFSGCSGLTSVTISSSVTSIESYAFSGCSGLTAISVGAANPIYSSVDGVWFNKAQTWLKLYPAGKGGAYTIPDSVTSIGGSAFSGCSGLTSVTIPDGVTSIGGSAFSGCSGLTSVTIPDGVTSIGSSTFSGCSGLTSVTIPDGVTSIGNRAFYGCSGVTALLVDAANPDYSSVGGVLFNKLQTGLVLYPPGRAGAYTIPSNVTTIKGHAFSGCSGLTGVTISSSVTSIEGYAFDDCSGLTSVTIPSSVTSIEGYAFTIPSSVTSIGDFALLGCTSLTATHFLGNAPGLDSSRVFGSVNPTHGIYYLSSSMCNN